MENFLDLFFIYRLVSFPFCCFGSEKKRLHANFVLLIITEIEGVALRLAALLYMLRFVLHSDLFLSLVGELRKGLHLLEILDISMPTYLKTDHVSSSPLSLPLQKKKTTKETCELAWYKFA